MNALNYDCHRQFLSDYLETHALTLRAFAEKTEGTTTIGALSHFLKRDHRGAFQGRYSFRLETWIQILERMNLKTQDFEYLIALKIAADLEAKFGPDGRPQNFANSVKKLLRGQIKKSYKDSKTLSAKALQVAHLYDLLPKSLRQELTSEAIRLAEYFKAGQRTRSRILNVTRITKSLMK